MFSVLKAQTCSSVMETNMVRSTDLPWAFGETAVAACEFVMGLKEIWSN